MADARLPFARRVLDLAHLAAGVHRLSSAWGTVLAEAVRVCLDDQQHVSPSEMDFDGSFDERFALHWEPATDELWRTHNDSDVATEHAAYGVALLALPALTGLTVIERSRKGTGFDFWLGDSDDDDVLAFQHKARLEVSGIRRGSQAVIAERTARKVMQIRRSDAMAVPAYVAVVEFGTPCARVVKR